jgi:phosphatidate cytidylyltransferase
VSEGEAAAAAEQGSRNLAARVIVAVVLAPLAIAIAYAGGWLWTALVTVVSIGLYVEWLGIVGAVRERRVVAFGVGALAIGGLCLGLGRIDAALVALAIGLSGVAALSPAPRPWTATGFFYAAAAEIASVLVRLDQVWGFVALILVLLVVWATDIGGYFAGRGIGGPKLWPLVSPKKTWAGALGGFSASLAVAAGFAALGLGGGSLYFIAAWRSVRIGGQAAFRRQGLQPHHPRAWRSDGSPRRVRRGSAAGGDFRTFAGRRGWRRPRSYGLVKT